MEIGQSSLTIFGHMIFSICRQKLVYHYWQQMDATDSLLAQTPVKGTQLYDMQFVYQYFNYEWNECAWYNGNDWYWFVKIETSSFNQISLTITYYIYLRSFFIPVLYSLEYRVSASNSVLSVQWKLDWLVLLFRDDDCERYSWSYDPEKYITTLNYHISKAKVHTCIAINKLSLNYKLFILKKLSLVLKTFSGSPKSRTRGKPFFFFFFKA